MEKDYKVETKPTYWEVILSSGHYSDYEESHLFFAGNDENEIWNFLKRYTDDVAKKNDYLHGVNMNGLSLAMKWNDERFISKNFTGDKDDIFWDNEYNIAKVNIKRLNVIYFKN